MADTEAPVIAPPRDIFAQIAALALTGRPLIVCDVDEVVLHFIEPLEAFMRRNGFELIEPRYKLTGNIRAIGGGELAPAETVRDLIHGFFAEETENQQPVAHAAETMARLAERAQVVMMTNMPERFRAARERTLARHAFPYPVLTNTGPKGPAVADLAARLDAPMVFLDDSPSNIASVRDHAADVRLVQFMADERFFALAERVEGAHHFSNCWKDTGGYIDDVLGV